MMMMPWNLASTSYAKMLLEVEVICSDWHGKPKKFAKKLPNLWLASELGGEVVAVLVFRWCTCTQRVRLAFSSDREVLPQIKWILEKLEGICNIWNFDVASLVMLGEPCAGKKSIGP